MKDNTMLPQPFDSLPSADQQLLECRKSSYVFHQEDASTGLYFLVTGGVHLIRVSEQGEEVVIHRALRGETFAEASIFSESYHCNALAVEDTQLIKIPKDTILEKISTDADFALYLTKRFAMQVQRQRRLREILSIRNADDRVFAGMCIGMLDGPIKAFASEIGLSHEATYRALNQLSKQGRVAKFARGNYRILKRKTPLTLQ